MTAGLNHVAPQRVVKLVNALRLGYGPVNWVLSKNRV
jgi:hypothetical protein